MNETSWTHLQLQQHLSRKRPWRSTTSTWQSPLFSTQTVQCDAEDPHKAEQQQRELLLSSIREEKLQVQAELDRLDKEGPCPSCLYTGVATCVGLAGYFGYLAFDELPPPPVAGDTAKRLLAVSKQRPYQRPVYLAIAGGWLALGAYRWHLG